MNENGKPVTIKILDKEYLISCDEDEREQLHTAVSYLNTKMLDMKNSGRVIGSERNGLDVITITAPVVITPPYLLSSSGVRVKAMSRRFTLIP